MSCEKGRKNKLNIGDIVTIRPKTVEWFVTHIADNYSVLIEDTYYKREIRTTSLPEIGNWIYAYQTKKTLKGKVSRYGAIDSDNLGKEIPGLQNVGVVIKGRFGDWFCYLSERNLKKIKSGGK